MDQNFEEDRGYLFDIEVSQENISIERINTNVGSEIIIWSNEETINKLIEDNSYPKWYDWYCFDQPAIHYYIDDNEIMHEEEYVPDENEHFAGWAALDTTEFKSYKWSYTHPIIEDINSYCNGIPIPKRCILSGKKYGFNLADPVVSIVDYKDKVEINLSRSQLSSFPCEEQFIKEGYKYALAQLIYRNDITTKEDFWEFFDYGFPWCKEFAYNKIKTTEITPSAYLLSKEGYTLMTPAFLYNAKIKRVKVLFVKTDYLETCGEISLEDPVYICCVGNRKRRTFFMDIFKGLFDDNTLMEKALYFDVEHQFFNAELKVLFEKFEIMRKLKLSETNEAYYRYIIEDNNSNIDLAKQRKMPTQDNQASILATLTYEIDYSDGIRNTMLDMLEKYLPEGWIPYAFAQRKEKYSETFKKLEKYALNLQI